MIRGGIAMIRMTDNLHEFRKFLLKDLMKIGYKYIARDKDGALYAYNGKPIKLKENWDFEVPAAQACELLRDI